MTNNKRLGRGLESLLSRGSVNHKFDNDSQDSSDNSGTVETFKNETLQSEINIQQSVNTVLEINIEKLKASIYQPRKTFNDESIEELANSIQEHGLLEPLLVKRSDDETYEIICGERRYRASKLANLKTVPCLIKDDLKENAYAIALIENMQREDLNPLEQAEALSLMLSECKLTQDELAKTLGKSRSTISNIIRLNSLAPKTKDALRDGAIDMGHAKALLSLDGEVQEKACEIVVQKSMSVRQTEAFVKSVGDKDNETKEGDNKNQKDSVPESVSTLETLLKGKLDEQNVKFSYLGKNKGKITLSFKNEAEFNRIKEIFNL